MQKRIDYIDNVKGILILLVVIGHVFTKGHLYNFIFTFHMPAFLIASGILLYKTHASNKIWSIILRRKTLTLIVPYIVFETLGIVVSIIRNGATLNIKGYLFNSIIGSCNNAPCWFLYALFFSEIVFLALRKTIKSDAILFSSVVISAILIMCFVPNEPFYFRNLIRIAVSVLFLYVGYFVAKLGNGKTFTVKYASTFICGILSIIVSLINADVYLSGCIFNNIPLYLLGSLAGTYLILSISLRNCTNIFKHFGRNSLIVLGTHQQLYLLLHKYMFSDDTFISLFLCLMTVVILEIPIIHFFNKYIPFLIGKKRS